jgi:hypothetical protein
LVLLMLRWGLLEAALLLRRGVRLLLLHLRVLLLLGRSIWRLLLVRRLLLLLLLLLLLRIRRLLLMVWRLPLRMLWRKVLLLLLRRAALGRVWLLLLRVSRHGGGLGVSLGIVRRASLIGPGEYIARAVSTGAIVCASVR